MAQVDLIAGGLFTGPVWTWVGTAGPAWRLEATAGDRRYRASLASGELAGELHRGWLGSEVTLLGADGSRAVVAPRPLFGREQRITLPAAAPGRVVRETAGLRLTTAEQWLLELPPALGEPLLTLVLCVPVVLDHRRRRRRITGADVIGIG